MVIKNNGCVKWAISGFGSWGQITKKKKIGRRRRRRRFECGEFGGKFYY